MELKYVSGDKQVAKIDVLIVPLWNWNMAEQLQESFDDSFNRTFMELKLVWRIDKFFS